jgi:hypothetical protein
VNTDWSEVLTSRPPAESADISVAAILKLFFSCAVCSSCSGLVICFCCQYQLFQFSSDLVFFSDSKGFSPRCITLGVTRFLDFGHCLEF